MEGEKVRISFLDSVGAEREAKGDVVDCVGRCGRGDSGRGNRDGDGGRH